LLKYEEIVINKCRPYLKEINGVNVMRLKKDIYVQIITKKRPDLMQLCIEPIYDSKTTEWRARIQSRNTKRKTLLNPETVKIIEKEISAKQLFGGKIPPFFESKLTKEEWMEEKEEHPEFKDTRIECPPTTVKDLYASKGCHYIQLEGKGLYHLGMDPLAIGVPELRCPQRFRVRIKNHGTKGGFMNLSVTAAIQFSNPRQIRPSYFSLDGRGKFPPLDNIL